MYILIIFIVQSDSLELCSINIIPWTKSQTWSMCSYNIPSQCRKERTILTTDDFFDFLGNFLISNFSLSSWGKVSRNSAYFISYSLCTCRTDWLNQIKKYTQPYQWCYWRCLSIVHMWEPIEKSSTYILPCQSYMQDTILLTEIIVTERMVPCGMCSKE